MVCKYGILLFSSIFSNICLSDISSNISNSIGHQNVKMDTNQFQNYYRLVAYYGIADDDIYLIFDISILRTSIFKALW